MKTFEIKPAVCLQRPQSLENGQMIFEQLEALGCPGKGYSEGSMLIPVPTGPHPDFASSLRLLGRGGNRRRQLTGMAKGNR